MATDPRGHDGEELFGGCVISDDRRLSADPTVHSQASGSAAGALMVNVGSAARASRLTSTVG